MQKIINVAPPVGAWIEIKILSNHHGETGVAPHVGAWIEIVFIINRSVSTLGRSSHRGVDRVCFTLYVQLLFTPRQKNTLAKVQIFIVELIYRLFELYVKHRQYLVKNLY